MLAKLRYPHWVPPAFVVLIALTSAAAEEGQELLGTKPAEWQITNWINSKPLMLKDLSGKVVLVRWWTGPFCELCSASAPALNEFHERYADKGLVVIGFYHHKSPLPLQVDSVKRQAEKLGFKFPVAVDSDWQTLRRWWLDGNERKFTSVSFLIDPQGEIGTFIPAGRS